ncbi:unnamed protein product [Amoebophrya sp. A25]|nr:unnamed protein product [Amoebophrya sp. A25]|eukprot:GSA25T00003029001.1
MLQLCEEADEDSEKISSQVLLLCSAPKSYLTCSRIAGRSKSYLRCSSSTACLFLEIRRR